MHSHLNITNHERLVDALGEWPLFNDAEVVSFSAERALPTTPGATWARITIRKSQWVATFLFRDVTVLELSGFNHQNVIDDFRVSQRDVGLLVEIEHCWGLSGVLHCASAEIEHVTIHTENA